MIETVVWADQKGSSSLPLGSMMARSAWLLAAHSIAAQQDRWAVAESEIQAEVTQKPFFQVTLEGG
jgi:hypothetical protein